MPDIMIMILINTNLTITMKIKIIIAVFWRFRKKKDLAKKNVGGNLKLSTAFAVFIIFIIYSKYFFISDWLKSPGYNTTSVDQIWNMFVNISTGDVYCTGIDRKMDSRRHGSSAVLADLEKMAKDFNWWI